MGQKVNPKGYRLASKKEKNWESNLFEELNNYKGYPEEVSLEEQIRNYIGGALNKANLKITSFQRKVYKVGVNINKPGEKKLNTEDVKQNVILIEELTAGVLFDCKEYITLPVIQRIGFNPENVIKGLDSQIAIDPSFYNTNGRAINTLTNLTNLSDSTKPNPAIPKLWERWFDEIDVRYPKFKDIKEVEGKQKKEENKVKYKKKKKNYKDETLLNVKRLAEKLSNISGRPTVVKINAEEALITARTLCTALKERYRKQKVVNWKSEIDKLLKDRSIKPSALKVVTSGRIKGSDIARSEKYELGETQNIGISLQQLDNDVDYYFDDFLTRYGIMSLHVWLVPSCKLYTLTTRSSFFIPDSYSLNKLSDSIDLPHPNAGKDIFKSTLSKKVLNELTTRLPICWLTTQYPKKKKDKDLAFLHSILNYINNGGLPAMQRSVIAKALRDLYCKPNLDFECDLDIDFDLENLDELNSKIKLDKKQKTELKGLTQIVNIIDSDDIEDMRLNSEAIKKKLNKQRNTRYFGYKESKKTIDWVTAELKNVTEIINKITAFPSYETYIQTFGEELPSGEKLTYDAYLLRKMQYYRIKQDIKRQAGKTKLLEKKIKRKTAKN